MPQLDQFTYLTQFPRLCVFHMTPYALLYNDGSPKISRIIKPRKRLVSQEKVGAEQSNDRVEQDVVSKECFRASANYPYSSVFGASEWCKEMVQLADANKLQGTNKDHVCPLGEISVSQVIKNNALSTLGPSTYQTTSPASRRTTALNGIYVLRGQKRTPAKIRNGPKKRKISRDGERGEEMLCRTKILHLRPQLDQFTYLTQFTCLPLPHTTPRFVLYSVLVFTNTEWPFILLRKRLVPEVGA